MSELHYTVQVTDERLNGLIIIENAYVNGTGLNALLQHMLNLNQHHRRIFMNQLIATGHHVYRSLPYHPRPYTISAIKVAQPWDTTIPGPISVSKQLQE